MAKFAERFKRTDWNFYKRSEEESVTALTEALETLYHTTDEEQLAVTETALEELLGGKGANTYYPVVVPALPFLFDIALEPPTARGQKIALKLLLHIACSEPELGDFKGMDRELIENAVIMEYAGHEDDFAGTSLGDDENAKMFLKLSKMISRFVGEID